MIESLIKKGREAYGMALKTNIHSCLKGDVRAALAWREEFTQKRAIIEARRAGEPIPENPRKDFNKLESGKNTCFQLKL